MGRAHISCDCDTDVLLPASRIKRIHVNQHNIKRNRQQGESEPVITVKSADGNDYGHQVDLLLPDGTVAASVVYRRNRPLNCGAEVWIETELAVRVHPDPLPG